jgi:hypothetical protein
MWHWGCLVGTKFPSVAAPARRYPGLPVCTSIPSPVTRNAVGASRLVEEPCRLSLPVMVGLLGSYLGVRIPVALASEIRKLAELYRV